MNCPDNYDQFLAHEAKMEKMLEKLPECETCGETIQDDFYFEINDCIMCERCMIENHRKRIEDFIS